MKSMKQNGMHVFQEQGSLQKGWCPEHVLLKRIYVYVHIIYIYWMGPKKYVLVTSMFL